jgi:hypothetical protein
MSEHDPNQPDELTEVLQSVRKRLGRMTVAMMLMILAVLLSTAAIFGQLADWHGEEPLLLGASAVGAAVLGFILGFIAGRRM